MHAKNHNELGVVEDGLAVSRQPWGNLYADGVLLLEEYTLHWVDRMDEGSEKVSYLDLVASVLNPNAHDPGFFEPMLEVRFGRSMNSKQ